MVHPEMETVLEAKNKLSLGGLQGMYSTTEKWNPIFEYKGDSEIGAWNHPYIRPWWSGRDSAWIYLFWTSPYAIENALVAIHFPKDLNELRLAQFRLKFEELLFIQLNILRNAKIREKRFRGLPFSKIGHYFNTFYSEHLPFQLTDAQKRVLKEIRADVGSGRQMNRLLQGMWAVVRRWWRSCPCWWHLIMATKLAWWHQPRYWQHNIMRQLGATWAFGRFCWVAYRVDKEEG